MKNINLYEKLQGQKAVSFFKEKLSNLYTVLDKDNFNFLDRISYFDTPDVNELYYVHGGEYWTCVQIYELSKFVPRKLLDSFMHTQKIMVTIDEEPLSNRETISFLGGNIDQESGNLELSNQYESFIRGKEKIESQADFLNYLHATGENCKTVTIRFYVHDRTLEDLNKLLEKMNDVLRDCELKGCIQTNNLDHDLRALTCLDNPVKQLCSSKGMAHMTMTNHVSIVDPYVSLLGYTDTGIYAPDFLNYRNSSFGVLAIGMQGSGKSALLKSISEDAILRDEQVIIFDMHNNEYAEIAKRYSIPSINFDRNMYINPCQIFHIENTQLNDDVIREEDIARVISLNSDIYMANSKEVSEEVLQQLRTHMREMYEPYLGQKLSKYKNNDWFVMTDIKRYVEHKKKQGAYDEYELADIYKLLLGLNDCTQVYGFLFNHHTNVEIDLTKSLRFDLSFLLEMNNENTLNAYTTLLLSYVGKALVMNERLNTQLEKEVTEKPERPLKPLYVVLEETGTAFKYGSFLKTVDTLMRQTRKGRTAFMFAFHTIQDIATDGKNGDMVRSVFGLCPNVIVGQIDNKTKELLPSFVKGFTDRDADVANHFRKSENDERSFIACNDQEEKIAFTSIITAEQRLYFGGGR